MEKGKRRKTNLPPPTVTKLPKKNILKVEAYINNVKLQVYASPEDWKKLGHSIPSHYYDEGFIYNFVSDFYHSFIDPAIDKIHGFEDKKPKGKNRYTANLVNEIKSCAGWVYSVLSYWSKRPNNKQPEYIKKLINKIKKEDEAIKDYILNIDEATYSSKELTAYCIDKHFGEKASEAGLKPLFDVSDNDTIENFYITYIHGKKIPKKFKWAYINNQTPKRNEKIPKGEIWTFNNKTPEETDCTINYLVQRIPELSIIFKTLKII